MSRYASLWNKRDANEAPILEALGKIGVIWKEAGPLDGWICVAGQWIPCEIKMRSGRFTPAQEDFIQECETYDWPYAVWRTPEEAVEYVQVMREASQ